MPDTPPLRPRSPGKKPKQKNPAKSPKIVVPADDLKIKVAQAQKLAEALTAKKKATIKQSKLDANEKYQAGLADLGERIGHIFSTVQATQFQLNEALVRLRFVMNNEPDEKKNAKAQKLSQKVGPALKALKRLSDFVTNIKKSKEGLPVEKVSGALRGIDDVVGNAMEIRKQVVQLHQDVPKKLSDRKHVVLPKFRVVDGFTVIGEPASKSDQKIVAKLTKAMQMGADPFPDPFTVLWNEYGSSSMHLTPGVRLAVRYSVLFCAGKKPLPKRPTVLELYNGTGLDAAGNFNYDALNTMFRAVLGNMTRKMAGDDCKSFVLGADKLIKEDDYKFACDHVARIDSRGKKVLDDVRVSYARAVVQWFNTYVPVVV